MLYVVTKPPEFVSGTYTCAELSREHAASLIKDNHASKTCEPYIFHASTRRAIQQLTGIKFELVQKKSIPLPRDGDQFLHMKLKEKTGPGRPSLKDHVFVRIEFSTGI